ncbi:MAG TPA: DnaJ C-terminal domain-containing protein [Candidatus Binataceae bacterium]|nr:DnaJ C-terminal domain-containing protein [Candidatus Binataceae bacterium]
MEFRDYYKTLGVERSATADQIKSAYRKLARKHHPDVNPNNKEAERKFKEINEAYQVLSDPEKRKKYDELGADWEHGASQEEVFRRYAQGGPGGAHFETGDAGGFSDFFERFFGGLGTGAARHGGGFQGFDFVEGIGGRRPSRGAARRGSDLEAEAVISLQDAVQGATTRLDFVIEEACDACGGTGLIAGKQERRANSRVLHSADPCHKCAGNGMVRARRTLEVTIPAGISDGTRMRLKGQGAKGPRPDLNGDLFVMVKINPGAGFALAGRDIRCTLPVWDYEASLGAEVAAPTPTGKIALKIPADSQNGRVMRLRGKGLPARGKDPAGDLLYELRVLAPTDLTEEERQLMRRLADSRRARGVADPRAELLRS